MKKHKEILAGIVISIIGFIFAILIALVVVESKVPSNASNDGWLGFLGGLFGSFISGMITFGVLYINRKDMIDGDIRRKKTSEMDRMESDLKDAFALLRIEGNIATAESYFLFIFSKIPNEYRETEYYKELSEVYHDCKNGKTQTALMFEKTVYKAFVEYREMYIEGEKYAVVKKESEKGVL